MCVYRRKSWEFGDAHERKIDHEAVLNMVALSAMPSASDALRRLRSSRGKCSTRDFENEKRRWA